MKYEYKVYKLINTGNSLEEVLNKYSNLGYRLINLLQNKCDVPYLIFEKEIEEDKQPSIEDQPQPRYTLDQVYTALSHIRDFCNVVNSCGYYSSTGYAGQVLAWHIKQLESQLDAKNDTK